MGAHDCIHTLSKDLDREGVRSQVAALQDRAEWEHGHDPYNGTISTMERGVVFIEEEAKDDGEAYDRILDEHEKREAPLAMKVKDGPWLVGGWAAS